MVSKVLLKIVIELERQSRAAEGERKTSRSSIPGSVPSLQGGRRFWNYKNYGSKRMLVIY